MLRRAGRLTECLAWLVLAACGCSDGSAPPEVAASGNAGAAVARIPLDPANVPETADAAVQAVIDGMKQGHPEALWYFLPASYQGDVNEVIHEFASRMDAELWSRTVAVLEKLARVIKSQRELVQSTLAPPPRDNGAAGPPPLDPAGLADLLQVLLRSELGDLERLKQADVGHFLAETGGPLLAQLQSLSRMTPGDGLSLRMEDLSRLKVAPVSSDGDEAVIEVQAPGEDPRELEFVRVEGKWIPRNLADGWIEAIGQAKARLSLLSRENLAEQKPQWLTLIATVDSALDQMAAARTRDEFAGAAQGLLLPGMMLAALFQGGPGEDRPDSAEQPPGAQNMVTVIVRGKLDGPAQDALRDRLAALTGAGEGALGEFTGDDELTSFKIAPAADVEAFANRIDFLKIVEVDSGRRTITATLVK